MKLLLDTTYFLPLIGISIKDIPHDIIIRLIEKGYKILLSEISIFEISAKGAKYVSLGRLSPTKVSRGIKALLYDERIVKVPVYETSIISTSFELRRILSDYIDCLILSSAINNAEILVTEDDEIHKIYSREDFKRIINRLNPEFKIKRAKEVSYPAI